MVWGLFATSQFCDHSVVRNGNFQKFLHCHARCGLPPSHVRHGVAFRLSHCDHCVVAITRRLIEPEKQPTAALRSPASRPADDSGDDSGPRLEQPPFTTYHSCLHGAAAPVVGRGSVPGVNAHGLRFGCLSMDPPTTRRFAPLPTATADCQLGCPLPLLPFPSPGKARKGISHPLAQDHAGIMQIL